MGDDTESNLDISDRNDGLRCPKTKVDAVVVDDATEEGVVRDSTCGNHGFGMLFRDDGDCIVLVLVLNDGGGR
jgi:hypothetical protein